MLVLLATYYAQNYAGIIGWSLIGEHKVVVDLGSFISFIQGSMVIPFLNKHKISGLQLTSASGDNIPILGCITLPLCIGELQATHPLVAVKFLITPVLGLDFLQKHGIIYIVLSRLTHNRTTQVSMIIQKM